MPVLSDLRVSVTAEDLTRSWGPQRARLVSPRMLARVSELLERIEAQHWLQPQISFQFWPVAEVTPEGIELANGSRLRAPLAFDYFRGATQLGIGVCTLGGTLEKHVAESFESRDRLRGVLLDEIGTLALYQLSDRLDERMQEDAALLGLDISGILNPGDDGFDLSEHGLLLSLSGGAEIGLSVTMLGMLRPQKSISLVVGLGEDMPKWNPADRCERCKMKDRCPNRRSLIQEVAQ